ncbi:MAG: hypothetical protein AB2765_17595 [Candidatus Thiodiazotropha endolucinida]
MKTTERSTGSHSNIIEITTTPAARIRTKIQREIIRLDNTLGLHAPRSAQDTLINYADILELNAIYLAGKEDPALQPVVESLIDLVARIRYWLA